MPYVRRKTDNVLVRLDVYYNYILELKFGIGIGEDGLPLRPTDAQQALFREVFGEHAIEAAPTEWYYVDAQMADNILPPVWRKLDMHDRARWLAAKRIKGMATALERYREVIERKNREALSKLRSRRK